MLRTELQVVVAGRPGLWAAGTAEIGIGGRLCPCTVEYHLSENHKGPHNIRTLLLRLLVGHCADTNTAGHILLDEHLPQNRSLRDYS